jgi:hypothetical protein
MQQVGAMIAGFFNRPDAINPEWRAEGSGKPAGSTFKTKHILQKNPRNAMNTSGTRMVGLESLR